MLFNTIKYILYHPLNRKNKLQAFKRYINWQLGIRLLPFPLIFPFVENSKLIIKKGMNGATGNLYCGLHDFEEMSFTIHFLRPDDYFADVGANIGSYTILASCISGAFSFAFEPAPDTFSNLMDNIKVNNILNKVQAINSCLGDFARKIKFSIDLDTVNHVLLDNTEQNRFVYIDVNLLDDYFKEVIPSLIKIDVEGFEMQVLQGGAKTLSNFGLKAVIIEMNGSGSLYGHSNKIFITYYVL